MTWTEKFKLRENGGTAGAAAEQGANKNIAATAEIKELIYFIVVVLAVIKTKAVCFNFYFNKDFK